MRRYQRWLRVLAGGAVTLGWLQAWELIDFASFFTQFLAQLLAALVTALLGGDASVYFT